MKRKFLVTGGAGFIGSHIAEELLHQGRGDVVVLDNLSVGKRENVPAGATLLVGDIKDRTSCGSAWKEWIPYFTMQPL